MDPQIAAFLASLATAQAAVLDLFVKLEAVLPVNPPQVDSDRLDVGAAKQSIFCAHADLKAVKELFDAGHQNA